MCVCVLCVSLFTYLYVHTLKKKKKFDGNPRHVVNLEDGGEVFFNFTTEDDPHFIFHQNIHVKSTQNQRVKNRWVRKEIYSTTSYIDLMKYTCRKYVLPTFFV